LERDTTILTIGIVVLLLVTCCAALAVVMAALLVFGISLPFTP
jgi:cell division protein FtsW (lipid II flippase)